MKICNSRCFIPITCVALCLGAIAKAAPGDDSRHPILLIDSRILKILEERVASAKTEKEVVALLGKPDRKDLIGVGIGVLIYRWPTEASFRYKNDKSRWYLSGISFRINARTGKVISWSWKHLKVSSREESLKMFRESFDRDYEMLRSMDDEDQDKVEEVDKE